MGIQLHQTTLAALKNLDIRLCFFDVDGTLLGKSGVLSKRTIDSIARFRDKGGLIAIASGRPAFSAKEIMLQLGINAPSVFFSGALVINPISGCALREQGLAKDEILKVRQYAREHDLHLEYYTSQNYFVEKASHFGEIHAHYIHRLPTEAALESILAQGSILKLVLMSDAAPQTAALRQVETKVEHIALGIGYGASHPNVTFGNITSADSSRDVAYDFVLEKLGLNSAQVASFGDGESDLPFMLRSGLGVAMANAPQAVRDRAPFITADVEQDGVALVMEALVAASS